MDSTNNGTKKLLTRAELEEGIIRNFPGIDEGSLNGLIQWYYEDPVGSVRAVMGLRWIEEKGWK